MAKQHKITEELCESCVYQTGHANETGPFGICGYLLAFTLSIVSIHSKSRAPQHTNDNLPVSCFIIFERRDE